MTGYACRRVTGDGAVVGECAVVSDVFHDVFYDVTMGSGMCFVMWFVM